MWENRTPASARGLVGNGESYLNAKEKVRLHPYIPRYKLRA